MISTSRLCGRLTVMILSSSGTFSVPMHTISALSPAYLVRCDCVTYYTFACLFATPFPLSLPTPLTSFFLHPTTSTFLPSSPYVANLFASGSRDGVVLLWSTSSLSAMKMFNCADGMPREIVQSIGTLSTTSPLTEIKHILVIGEVGTSLVVYIAE